MGCGSSKSAAEVADPAEAAPPVAAAASVPLPEQQQPAVPHPEPPAPKPLASGSGPAAATLREATEKPLIIFVVGGPGSGKGTQCAKIVETYGGGFRHLSTGDLLRAEVKKGSELGSSLEATMKSGALVSDDQVIALLEKEISASAWFGTAYLVDGFPRAVTQAESFEQRVRPCDLVLYFECPEQEMVARLTERGKSSGRQDDNAETIKERLQTFQKQSLPIVEYYSKRGKLKSISAVPPPEEVFQEVKETLDKLLGMEGAGSEQPHAPEWRPSALVQIENLYYGARQEA